ncbi:MAG: translation initiation factor IF-6 [Sulfolobaceae archaeon]
MNINKLSIFNNDNLGVYIFCNDKYVIIPKGIDVKTKELIAETLKAEIIEAEVARSPLIGVFLVGNNNVLLVPKIITTEELSYLKQNLKDMRVEIFESKVTALGNTILLNDHAAYLYQDFSNEEVTRLSKLLQLDNIKKGTIANFITIGAVAVVTNRGGVVHIDATDNEVKELEKLFKVKIGVSTVNFGSVFLRSGLVANSKGALVGSSTTGPEILRIQKSLSGEV